MAHRSIKRKQANRLRKALTRHPLPAYRDLVAWLKVRRYAATTREARVIILAGRVKSDSHELGVRRNVPVRQLDGSVAKEDVIDQFVPVERMKNITVASA